jgi:hypothetical protein
MAHPVSHRDRRGARLLRKRPCVTRFLCTRFCAPGRGTNWQGATREHTGRIQPLSDMEQRWQLRDAASVELIELDFTGVDP